MGFGQTMEELGRMREGGGADKRGWLDEGWTGRMGEGWGG